MTLIDKARSNEKQLVSDLSELIKIPSIYEKDTISKHAPFGKPIREALDWILNKARMDGFEVEDIDGYAGVISLGEGDEAISMLGHLDVVPVGEGWTKDPFGAEVENGFLYGRGSGDDKGPTIAAYHALKLIKDMNLPLKKKLMLIVGTDEESGMSCMAYFKKNYAPLPVMGFVPDADFPVIYGEKGILNLRIEGQQESVIHSFNAGDRPNIVIGKASVSVNGPLLEDLFKLYLRQNNLVGSCQTIDNMSVYEIEGKYFHASIPHRGINAGTHLLKFVGGAYEDKLAMGLGNVLSDTFGQNLNIYFAGNHMGELTMNVGIIHINDSQVDITLDIRYPHELTHQEIVTKASEVIEGLGLKLSVIAQDDPLFVDPNSELVKACMESYQSITHDFDTPPLTMGGGTYARVLDNHVAFGPVMPKRPYPEYVGGPHEKDEAVEIETLIQATAIYATTLLKLAGE